jgi:hypothetical protein
MKRLLACLLLPAVLLFGCASVQTAALDKGSADLSCPKRSLRVSYAGPETYRTSGCGREKTYKCEQPKAMFRPYTCEEIKATETIAVPQVEPSPKPSPKPVAKKKAPSTRKKSR